MIDELKTPSSQQNAGAAANAEGAPGQPGHWPQGYGVPFATSDEHYGAGWAYPRLIGGPAGAAPFGYGYGVLPNGHAPGVPYAQGLAPFSWIAPGFASGPEAAHTGSLAPAIEMSETVEQLLLTVELPGVAEEDIRILLAGDMITIEAHRKARSELEVAGHYLSERRYGKLMRTVRLPYAPKSGEVSAELKDGLLLIRLAKAAQLRGKVEQIHLKVA